MVWNILHNLKNVETFQSDFAILVLNQPILIEPQLFQLIWNKATIRVLVDGGSNRFLSFVREKNLNDLGLPSFICGDFDSMKEETRTYFEKQNVKFIRTPDQDETDFTKALRCIADVIKDKKLRIKTILAACENSGRFDQIIGNVNTTIRSEKYLDNSTVIILSSQCVSWVLHPGRHSISVPEEFVKHQYPCGLIPFCGPTCVTTTGLKWNLSGQTMEFGGLISTSNTYLETRVNVSCDHNLVYTTQYHEITE